MQKKVFKPICLYFIFLRRIRKLFYRFRVKRALFILNKKYLDDYSDYAMKRKNIAMHHLCSKIDSTVRIAGGVFISAKLEIGKNVFIGRNFKAEGIGKIIIGDNCQISSNVTIITGDHEIGSSEKRAGNGVVNTIRIGDGTWVGNTVLILRNTSIGKGNVVAAGSVVINSSPDNTLIAGVPAQIKRHLL